MTKVLHGVVHGKTIELSEAPGVADGQEVEVVVIDKIIAEAKPKYHPKVLAFAEWYVQRLEKRAEAVAPDVKAYFSGASGGIRASAGAMADQWTDEDDRILEEIQQDRKRETRPE